MKINIPIFVINLERDHEKKAHMESLAYSIGMKFEFVNAVYGKEVGQVQIDEIYNESISQKKIGRGLTRGELGCALSHLSIYRKMVNEGIETALIIEDDVDISGDLQKIFEVIEKFPTNWELMLLGYYSETETERISMSSFFGKKRLTPEHQSTRLIELAFGTHGYIINLRGAKRLSRELNKIVKPIDHYTGSEQHLNMYAISPRIITLNQKFKQMGCINIERDIQFKQLENRLPLKTLLRNIWDFFRKIKLIFWLKKLPRRILPLKKYID